MTIEGYDGERVLLSYDASGAARAVATRVCQIIFGRRRISEGPSRATYQEKGFIHRPGGRVGWTERPLMSPSDARELSERLHMPGVRVATGPMSIPRSTLEAFGRNSGSPA